MSRISRDFIAQRLLPAVHIEEVIGKYLTLKHAGSNNLTCCCPFHHEKTPSFTVTPSKQMFYCFGCKAGGNAIDFLIKYKNLSFPDAVAELAEQYGLTVEYVNGRDSFSSSDYNERKKASYELMDRVAAAFSACLYQDQRALDYFMKKRGLTRDTILNCRLGYAPAQWDFLIQRVARSQEEVQRLKELGLLNEKNGRYYSMFRDRVMIPIVGKNGHIVSFGGRTLGDEKPKYLNTAETPIFRKRQELFGLYAALQANRNRPDRLVIVEGYMDVIALLQYGISYAVASLGTATTTEQFREMFRYTKKVVCCYDGDFAGRAAAWHALETVTPMLKEGYEIRFAFLPPEHDPDSLVRAQGTSAFIQVLDKSLSYPEFLVKHIQAEYDLSDPGQRGNFISAVLHRIKVIPADFRPMQAMCIEQLSLRVGIEGFRLENMLAEVKLSQNEQRAVDKAAQDGVPYSQQDRSALSGSRYLKTPMRQLIAFLLQQPTVVSGVFERFRLQDFMRLLKATGMKGWEDAEFFLTYIREHPAVTSAELLEVLRDSFREKYCRRLLGARFVPQASDGGEMTMEYKAEFLARLMSMVMQQFLRQTMEDLRFFRLDNEQFKDQRREITQAITALNKLRLEMRQKFI